MFIIKVFTLKIIITSLFVYYDQVLFNRFFPAVQIVPELS